MGPKIEIIVEAMDVIIVIMKGFIPTIEPNDISLIFLYLNNNPLSTEPFRVY